MCTIHLWLNLMSGIPSPKFFPLHLNFLTLHLLRRLLPQQSAATALLQLHLPLLAWDNKIYGPAKVVDSPAMDRDPGQGHLGVAQLADGPHLHVHLLYVLAQVARKQHLVTLWAFGLLLIMHLSGEIVIGKSNWMQGRIVQLVAHLI